MKFEYEIVLRPLHLSANELNEMGFKGWLLVSVTEEAMRSSNARWRYVFARKVAK
jgi:hypothetical protein